MSSIMDDIDYKDIIGIWTIHFEDGTTKNLSGNLDANSYSLMVYGEIDASCILFAIEKNINFYVTGRTVHNTNMTLYGCFFVKSSMTSGGLVYGKISFNEAIMGSVLLENKTKQKFIGIEFELSCFESLMIPEEGIVEHVDRYGEVSLYNEYINGTKNIKCLVRFKNEISIQDSIDIMQEIRFFFVFLYCNRVNIYNSVLSVRQDNGKIINLVLISRTYSDKPITQYHHEIFTRIGKNLISRWSSIYPVYKEQIKPIFEILTHDDTGSERALVTCAHALEGFFRIISRKENSFKKYKIDNNLFESHIKEIKNILCSGKIEEKVCTSIKAALKYANEVTLKDKLRQLLCSFLNENLYSYFVIAPKGEEDIDIDKYLYVIVNIRNYYAHLDSSNMKNDIACVINDIEEIYNYKVSLFSFLYVLIAKEYFFNDSQVEYRILNNISFPFTSQFYENRIKKKN